MRYSIRDSIATSSRCGSLVHRLVLFCMGSHKACNCHDTAWLSLDWCTRGDYPMVRFIQALAVIKTYSLPILGFWRLISKHLLLSPPSHANAADASVEWAYAFDVHTNAFFPFYLTLYLAQLFLVPILLKDNWVCLWLGNTLYLAGCVYSKI